MVKETEYKRGETPIEPTFSIKYRQIKPNELGRFISQALSKDLFVHGDLLLDKFLSKFAQVFDQLVNNREPTIDQMIELINKEVLEFFTILPLVGEKRLYNQNVRLILEALAAFNTHHLAYFGPLPDQARYYLDQIIKELNKRIDIERRYNPAERTVVNLIRHQRKEYPAQEWQHWRTRQEVRELKNLAESQDIIGILEYLMQYHGEVPLPESILQINPDGSIPLADQPQPELSQEFYKLWASILHFDKPITLYTRPYYAYTPHIFYNLQLTVDGSSDVGRATLTQKLLRPNVKIDQIREELVSRFGNVFHFTKIIKNGGNKIMLFEVNEESGIEYHGIRHLEIRQKESALIFGENSNPGELEISLHFFFASIGPQFLVKNFFPIINTIARLTPPEVPVSDV